MLFYSSIETCYKYVPFEELFFLMVFFHLVHNTILRSQIVISCFSLIYRGVIESSRVEPSIKQARLGSVLKE